jgi:hypothetical protein
MITRQMPMLAIALILVGCQAEKEDKTRMSWNQYVADAKSGDTEFFRELATDMKANGFSYAWSSSNYRPDDHAGEILLKVEPPISEPYEIKFVFELKDGKWETTQGLLYRDEKPDGRG